MVVKETFPIQAMKVMYTCPNSSTAQNKTLTIGRNTYCLLVVLHVKVLFVYPTPERKQGARSRLPCQLREVRVLVSPESGWYWCLQLTKKMAF